MLSSVILWRVPFMRLVTDVVLKIIKFFFFCVCVFDRLFISRYKAEFLNCGIFVFFRFQFMTIDPSHLSTEHSVTNKHEEYFTVILL